MVEKTLRNSPRFNKVNDLLSSFAYYFISNTKAANKHHEEFDNYDFEFGEFDDNREFNYYSDIYNHSSQQEDHSSQQKEDHNKKRSQQ